MARKGRPSKYNNAVAERICARLAQGETLRSICRDESMPHEATVRQWAAQDYRGFYTQYARSRDLGLDAMADEMMDVADNASNDYMEREDPDNPGFNFMGEHVQRSRLRVDTRKWYLSKLAPKRYGDRQQLDHTSSDGSMTPHRIELVPVDTDDDGTD